MSWSNKDVLDATGAVPFACSVPPRAENFEQLRALGCTLHPQPEVEGVRLGGAEQCPSEGSVGIAPSSAV